ncbi:MAG: hypothetical protein ACR2L6_13020 [Gemmatimonadaceae bacterium]
MIPLTRIPALVAAAYLSLACATLPVPGVTLGPEQEAFWAAIEAHCGRAFEGRVAISTGSAGDTAMAGKRLVMHVRECRTDEIRIPFHVGEDRSRTWVLTRTATGLRLKHDHRHEDGKPDEITQYGGDTRDPGSSRSQSFPADAHTISLNPVYGTNVWTMEIDPALFVYELIRVGTNRRFRVEFDLTRAVPAPPAPWGNYLGL